MEKRVEPINNLKEVSKKHLRKKILSIVIGLIALGIIIFFAVSSYNYFKFPEKEIGFGAEIESVLISEDGQNAYIKLKAESIENITKVKFIFKDSEGNKHVYETSEGISEISIPYKKGFLDWLFKKKFEGVYDYEINSSELGLDDFFNADELDVVFEYKTEEGEGVETPVLDTKKPSTQKPVTGGGSGGGGLSGGGGGGGGTTTSSTPTPTPTPCTNDTGCSSVGIFCDGNHSYNCTIGTDKCLDRMNLSKCSGTQYCNETIGCVELPECTDDNNCTIKSVCGKSFCNLISKTCQIKYNSTSDVCRQKAGECDIAEKCLGNSINCPTNGFNLIYCNDNLFCNGIETCINGNCQSGTPPSSSDNINCTIDNCDEINDRILHVTNNSYCADSISCTEDICNVNTGCIININNSKCPEGQACSSKTGCGVINCSSDADCDDNNKNTTDRCVYPGQANSYCYNHVLSISTSDEGWYSFAKDKHNSKIADDVITPPFRIKWMKEPLVCSGGVYSENLVHLSRDGIVLSLSPGQSFQNCVRKIAYNTTTGEELWRQTGGAAAADGGRKTHALIHEFVTGTNHHFNQPGNELLKGLYSPNMGTDRYANADPENSLYASFSAAGTDSTTGSLRVYDFSNYAGPHPVSEGKFNKGYQFEKFTTNYHNGRSTFSPEYIDLGERVKPWIRTDLRDNLNPKNRNWTIMLWFKFDGVLATEGAQYQYDYLFNKGAGYYGGAQGGYAARLKDGKLEYRLGNEYGYVQAANFTYNANEWNHLTITYDHQKERIYKNSQLVFERDNTKDLGSNTKSLSLGSMGEGNWRYGFSGLIDEFAIFDRALTDTEIAEIYNRPIVQADNPLLLLHLDNDSAFGENKDFIYDYSGNNFHGVPVYRHIPKMIWSKGWPRALSNLPLTIPDQDGYQSIHNNYIYINVEKSLNAFNASTGDLIWEKGISQETQNKRRSSGQPAINIGEIIHGGPIVYSGGTVYSLGSEAVDVSRSFLPVYKPVLLGYDAVDGREVLRLDLSTEESRKYAINMARENKNFIVENNILYLAFFYSYYLGLPVPYINSGGIIAIDLSSKQEIWNYTIKTLSDLQSLVLSGDLLFVSANNGIIALNKNTGEKIWQFKLPQSPGKSSSDQFTGLIIEDNTLFIGHQKGWVYAFEQGYTPPPEITNSNTQLPEGEVNKNYVQFSEYYWSTPVYKNYTFRVKNGQWPYTWEISNGNLSQGLRLQTDTDNYNSYLSGTPTESGNFTFTVKVTDSRGNSDEKEFSLTINTSLEQVATLSPFTKFINRFKNLFSKNSDDKTISGKAVSDNRDNIDNKVISSSSTSRGVPPWIKIAEFFKKLFRIKS